MRSSAPIHSAVMAALVIATVIGCLFIAIAGVRPEVWVPSVCVLLAGVLSWGLAQCTVDRERSNRFAALSKAVEKELRNAANNVFAAQGFALGALDAYHHLEKTGKLDSVEGLSRRLQAYGLDAVRRLPIEVAHSRALQEHAEQLPSGAYQSICDAYALLEELRGIRDAAIHVDPGSDFGTWTDRMRHFLARSHQFLFAHLWGALKAVGPMKMPGPSYWIPQQDRDGKGERCATCARLKGHHVTKLCVPPATAKKDVKLVCPRCDRADVKKWCKSKGLATEVLWNHVKGIPRDAPRHLREPE